MAETIIAETSMDAELILTLEDQVLQLADHEAWLDAQIRELEFANSQNTASTPTQQDRSVEETRRDLERNIDLLKQELATAVSMESIRAKVIYSGYTYQVVLKSLFKEHRDHDESELVASIDERDKAVTEYLRIHRQLQEARRELCNTQVQVLDLQDENRKLVQLLSDETAMAMKTATSSTQRTTKMIRMGEQLNNFIIKHNVVSNVLQGLLLESGIDWVNDEHYLDLMLKLKRTTEYIFN